MNLYPYQKYNIEQIKNVWTEYQSILYQLPTGGGKTVVINDIIESILDKKILILVHRKEIILQIRDRLKQRGIIAGVLIGNFEENIDSDILIGSIRTVARDSRLEDIIKRNFDYMIIDEAHHACSSTYIKTITDFKINNPNYKLLGVTATPYRKDGKKLADIFDVLIQGPTYSKLREDGFLAGYKCYAAKLEGLEQVNLSGGDFKLSDLSKYMRSDWLIEKAINMYKEKGQGKQMLVFCVDKKHAQQVQQSYFNAGFSNTAIINSDTGSDDRERINKLYREGKLDIIISIQTLTEGVDLPETGVVQLLRPTLSIVLYLQILGRGTRLKSDGSNLIILDLSNNSYEHGLLDSEYIWNLNNDDPNPKKKSKKIIARVGSKIITDQDQIEEEGLEIEEMDLEEYLSQQQDGIQIAENENSKIKDQINKKFSDLIKDLKTRCKIPNTNFIFDYSSWNLEHGWDEIGLKNAKHNSVNFTIKFDKTLKEKNLLKLNYEGYSRKWGFEDFILMGEYAKFIQSKSIYKLLLDTFKEVYILSTGYHNIQELKRKAREIKEKQCLIQIDEYLNAGNFKFTLKRQIGSYSHSFRELGSAFVITFEDKPNRLMSTNRITFHNESGYNTGTNNNAKKEAIFNILFNNWFENEEI